MNPDRASPGPGRPVDDVPRMRVRYIVSTLDQALPFYALCLGFSVKAQPSAHFAIVEKDGMELLLSAPGGMGGGCRAGRDGVLPAPGGWNRIQIVVADLDDNIARMKAAGIRLRGEPLSGLGGRQVLIEDPAGNPIEFFEPARRRQAIHPLNEG